MSQRITIVIDDNVAKKVRKLQALLIKETTKNVSFSSVINDILKASL